MIEQDYVERRSIGKADLWQETVPLLSRLDVELTERCNNACQHCYINLPVSDEKVHARELSTQQWQEIILQAAGLGALSVRFTGGEPLLRDDFAQLYTFTRRLGLKVCLFTNARLITPDLAGLFARIPPLERIEVTVYGLRPESYDAAACAPGAYVEFRRGIDLLLENHVPFIVKGALLPSNIDEMEAFEAWASTLPWMDEPPGYAMLFDLRTRHDSAPRNRHIESLRLSPEKVVSVLSRRAANYRKEMYSFCSSFIGPPGDRLFDCGAGRSGCVDAYGMYQPCMLLRDPACVYDLKTGTLKDALISFLPRMTVRKAENVEYLERCANCFLKGLCEQCPAKSWMENGTLDTPVEYLCQVAHAQARFLGLLNEGEFAWQIYDWKARIARMPRAETGKL